MVFMQVLGVVLMVCGIAGVAFWFYRSGKNAAMPISESVPGPVPVELPRPKQMKDRLREAEQDHLVQLTGEFNERKVNASINLNELTQMSKGAPWTRTGLVSKALCLSGGIWIFKVPAREGGKVAWFKGEEIDTPPLMSFYRSGETPDGKGPAKLFNENGQVNPVPYQLPRNLTSGITWEVVDIGAFGSEVDGETENVVNGDRLYFVTSREQNGERWLLYLDARRGDAQGTGGLFLAEPFEPAVDVTELI